MLTSTRGNSLCPRCGAVLDGVTVVRYGQPFRCPDCQTALLVPKFWLLVGFGVSIALALSLCLAIGLRGMSILLGLLAFLLPAMFSVGILLRKLWPPKLVVYQDPNSLLS